MPEGVLGEQCSGPTAHQSYEVEPFIEVLVATRKTATDEDKGLQWGKHPRHFQFWIQRLGEEVLFETNINGQGYLEGFV